MKGGGLKNSLEELELEDGIGSEGELSLTQLNSPLEYEEDEDCIVIEENLRAANQTLESALPGKYYFYQQVHVNNICIIN